MSHCFFLSFSCHPQVLGGAVIATTSLRHIPNPSFRIQERMQCLWLFLSLCGGLAGQCLAGRELGPPPLPHIVDKRNKASPREWQGRRGAAEPVTSHSRVTHRAEHSVVPARNTQGLEASVCGEREGGQGVARVGGRRGRDRVRFREREKRREQLTAEPARDHHGS